MVPIAIRETPAAAFFNFQKKGLLASEINPYPFGKLGLFCSSKVFSSLVNDEMVFNRGKSGKGEGGKNGTLVKNSSGTDLLNQPDSLLVSRHVFFRIPECILSRCALLLSSPVCCGAGFLQKTEAIYQSGSNGSLAPTSGLTCRSCQWVCN